MFVSSLSSVSLVSLFFFFAHLYWFLCSSVSLVFLFFSRLCSFIFHFVFAYFFTDLQVTTSMAALGDVGSDAPLRFAMLSASASAPSKGSVDAAGYGLSKLSRRV